MAKQLLVSLRAEDRVPKIIPSLKPAIQSGVKTNLLQGIAMLSGLVRGQHRRQTGESYAPRKSREDESRLEFQRFLEWCPLDYE